MSTFPGNTTKFINSSDPIKVYSLHCTANGLTDFDFGPRGILVHRLIDTSTWQATSHVRTTIKVGS